LQQGIPVSDILYLEGDRMPQYQPGTDLYELPVGYKSQPVNPDILISQARTDGSGMISAAGQQFRLLLLPNDSVMDPATLQGIADLVQNGAILFGPPPTATLSLNRLGENNADLKDLTMKIWGTVDGNIRTDREFGKGRVIWGESLASLIGRLGIKPDFEWISGDSAKLIFIHKRAGSDDIFYVANQEDRAVRTECRFRVEGKTPEIWDPQYGTIREIALFLSGDGCTRIPVTFGPKESFLFVFKEKISREYVASLSSGEGQLFPMEDPENMDGQSPEISYAENGYIVNSRESRDYMLTTSKGRSARVTTGGTEVVPVEDNEIEVIFDKEIPSLKISHPVSWTELDNPDQQFFSGSAVYSIDFSIPEGWLIREDPVYLLLGEVQMTARVSLNGQSLGTVWIPDYRLPVSGILKEGENLLEIEVANVYRNRIIGDLRQYGKMENIWTSAPVDDLFNPEMEPRISGLLGPVRIIRPRPAVVNFDD
ncbi:MAG: hypothetical protein KFF73_07205, partial [Cyclobacteriaceae bacterium]|nr:hypothetical protein [Cyclobacteriaceae bacterium]